MTPTDLIQMNVVKFTRNTRSVNRVSSRNWEIEPLSVSNQFSSFGFAQNSESRQFVPNHSGNSNAFSDQQVHSEFLSRFSKDDRPVVEDETGTHLDEFEEFMEGKRELINQIRHEMRSGEFEIQASFNLEERSRFFLGENRRLRSDHSTNIIFVVDIFGNNSPICEFATAVKANKSADLDEAVILQEVFDQMGRATLPTASMPREFKIHFAGSSGNVLMHEIVGHLLENRADRPSIIASHVGREITMSHLNVRDLPKTNNYLDFGQLSDLGSNLNDTSLISEGVLVNLLSSALDGPMRSNSGNSIPCPRVSWLEVTTGTETENDVAECWDEFPSVLKVHRVGLSQFDHRSGRYAITVLDATIPSDTGMRRVKPFKVCGDALDSLSKLSVLRTEVARAEHPWSGNCAGDSGVILVGGVSPNLGLPQTAFTTQSIS